jgi:rhamnulokinase
MTVLALDLGATSGRAAIGRFDGNTLSVEEVYRFPNDPVQLGDRFHWDVLRLYHETKQALCAAYHAAPDDLTSFGIDGWGLDFGLLDRDDELIGNPYHYRDTQAASAMESVWSIVPKREIYTRTGIQFISLNTLYQLAAIRGRNPALLDRATTLLQIPDLLRFFLTGDRTSEYTNASTTQMLSLSAHDWDRELLDRLSVPTGFLQPIVHAPAPGGTLRPSVQSELGLPPITATVVGEHDTASAVAAIPATGDFAYLSCGTWSLLGTEVSAPVVDERAFAWNFTNEGGLDGTYRLLKNITGLWLIESCRRAWVVTGESLSFAEILAAGETAPPFTSLIDPDAPAFVNPSAMPLAIQEWCRAAGQPVPKTRGALVRCIHESLALAFRHVLDRVELLTGRRFGGLHLVGGGVRNTTLCQYTANAIGRPVWAGPAEATTIGNILIQLINTGDIGNLREARQIVRSSFPTQTYEPTDTNAWDDAFQRFVPLLGSEPQTPSDAPKRQEEQA